MTDAELFKALDHLKATMISVSTGGARIQDVQADFAESYDAVDLELKLRAIENTLPYRDLWEWYGRWSSGDMPTYRSRREFVADAFKPLVASVQSGRSAQVQPTGWARVDRNVTEVRARLASAKAEEQFQAVGLLCRETLISLAKAVYNPEKHKTLDGVAASPTDAKRMLEAYVAVALQGDANEYVRKHARAALDLAVNLQHKRTATFRTAAVCVEATTSVVNLIAIMAGLRDPGTNSSES